MHRLSSTLSVIGLGLAVLAAACGGKDVTSQGPGSTADAASGDAIAKLGDGWQAQADATPPDDSWAWNADANQWVQGDATLADGWQAQADASPPDDSWSWNADAGAWQQADVADGAGDVADGTGDVADAAAQDGVAKPGQLGAPCSKHLDCKSKFCAGLGAGLPGYCSSFGCKASDDCAGVVSPDAPVCCLQYQGQGYCLKQPGATQCGSQDKMPGESCVAGGQSDCDAATSWCFQQGKSAQCVQLCSKTNDPACPAGTACNVFEGGGGCLPYTPGVPDGSPCAGKEIGGCGKYAYCIGTATNDAYAYCASACLVDGDCAAGLGCLIYQPGQGICQKVGARKAGSNCADDRFSCEKGLFCLGWGSADAICSPGCSTDSDCKGFAGSVGSEAYCAKGPDSPIGACYPKGSLKNGDSCGKDPLACEQGAFCIAGNDGYDPDAYCQKSCGSATNGTCPSGSQCVAYSAQYSGCQVQGSKVQGESCAGAPTSCQAGLTCIGASGAEICATLCTVGSSTCPSGTWCAGWGSDGKAGVCLPGGSLKVGTSCKAQPWACAAGSFCQQFGQAKDASCIAKCADDGTCPSGTDCKDFGEAGHYCEPVGGKTQGQDCSADSNSCAAGHVCIWKDTKYAICSKQCTQDADCTGGSGKQWCGKGKWGGYCLPEGSQPEFGSCFTQPFACGKGLLCLDDPSSNPGAFCAKECTGFASLCGSGSKCEYLGGGQSWCFPTGKLPHGSICLDDPKACDPSTLCIKGTPQSMCLQECGVGKPACPSDSPCTFFPGSPLKLCVPKTFTPFGALRAPF